MKTEQSLGIGDTQKLDAEDKNESENTELPISENNDSSGKDEIKEKENSDVKGLKSKTDTKVSESKSDETQKLPTTTAYAPGII